MSDEKRAVDGATGDDQRAGGKIPTDLKEAIAVLADERKRSAGLDRKVTELSNDAKALRDELERANAVAEGKTETSLEHTKKLAERSGELAALEAGIRQREEALNYALEKKISIPLTVGNSARLADFKKEVEGLYEDIYGAVDDLHRRKVNYAQLHGKIGAIGLSRIKGMKPAEIAKIPESILRRLEKEG